MKTKTIGTLILATTLTFGGLSYAMAAGNQAGMNNQDCTMMQDGSGKNKAGKHHGKGQNKGMGFEKLNLTDQQKAEMKTIMSAQKGQKRSQKSAEERLAHQAEMQALMNATSFDEAKATSLINAQQAKNSERKLAMMKAKYEMYQLLTDEQKAQFAEMQMQRANK